jgi:hypothetical protein
MMVLAVGASLTLALTARQQATGKLEGYRTPVSLFENNKDVLGVQLDGHLMRLEGKMVGRAQVLAYLEGGKSVELQVEVIPKDRVAIAWEEVAPSRGEVGTVPPTAEAEPPPPVPRLPARAARRR